MEYPDRQAASGPAGSDHRRQLTAHFRPRPGVPRGQLNSPRLPAGPVWPSQEPDHPQSVICASFNLPAERDDVLSRTEIFSFLQGAVRLESEYAAVNLAGE